MISEVEYRVELYDDNPLEPFDIQFLNKKQLVELIDYCKGIYPNHSRRKLGSVLYYEFWDNFSIDQLYLVIQEL